MTLGLVVKSGPLVPGEAATYALYTIALLWLIATTTVMVFGMNRAPISGGGIPSTASIAGGCRSQRFSPLLETE